MADTIRDLSGFIAAARGFRLPQFVKAHPYPFLVHTAADARLQDNPWEERSAFSTDIRDHDAEGPDDDDDDAPGEGPQPVRAIVVPVRKREGGLFADRIAIGRARNCDVVLRYPSVSKLHAQLLIGEQGWSVIDLSSANSTSLNGTRLVARKAHPIVLGDRLLLGEIELELVDAAAAYERLRAIKA